ncbi:MAG: C39 family peptidase [Mobilitalea sp.]
MKDINEIQPINANSSYKALPMSQIEKKQLIERRRQRAKRRRIRKMRRIFFFVNVLLIVIISITLWNKIRSISEKEFYSPTGSTADSVVNAPQILRADEVKIKLEKLADTSPEFQKVYSHADEYPQELLQALCNNPEMISYVSGYLTADGTPNGGITEEDLSKPIPLLLQWDTRWGYVPYGDSDVGQSGCAPTCLSMVIVALTGDTEATPNAVAAYSEKNGYYVEGTGTSWSLMTDGSSSFDISSRELPLSKSVIFSELESGHPIICSLRPGDFTTTGHFIVLTEVVDGEIRVNDPNSKARSSKLWSYETLEGQIKNLWVFEN